MSSILVFQSHYRSEQAWSPQLFGVGERIVAPVLRLCLAPVLRILCLAIQALFGRSPLLANRSGGQYNSKLLMGRLRHGELRALSAEPIDDEAGPAMKRTDDVRVAGRVARFCPQHSLDELLRPAEANAC